MVKRILAILIAVLLLFGSVQAAEIVPNTTSTLLPTAHMPGGTYQSVGVDDFISNESVSAAVTENGLQIAGGGSAKFGFYTRNNSRSVTVKYDTASTSATSLTLTSGENSYNFALDGSGEQTFLFYENLSTGAISPQAYGYNETNTVYYYKEFVEKSGEKEFVLETNGDILLYELVLEKEKTPAYLDPQDNSIVATVSHQLSAEEKVFMTTVLLHENASAIFVNGARRHISNEETSMRPYNNNGTLYIPIETLAKALGYYCEDNPNLAYALLRSDTHEVSMIGGECTVRQGVGEREDVPMEAFIYRNGKTLAAVRYFAELSGKTVKYDKGLVVIDNKYAVEDILNDEALRAYANSTLADFKKIPVEGKTYYVSQGEGDDSNNGSEEYPFYTISKAAAIAKAGDTVIVKDGVYNETLKPVNDGLANAPITFIAEGENVVISAADEVEDWEWVKEDEVLGIADTGKEVFRAYIGSDWNLGATLNQVFVNDVMQTEARYPDGPGVLMGDSGEGPSLSNAWPVRGDFTRTAGNANILKVGSSSLLAGQSDNYWQGGYYVGLFGYAFHITTGKIESSTENELTIGKERSNAWYAVPETANSAQTIYNYGYIVGHKNALSTEGEWIKDGDYIYMIPENGVDLNRSTVTVKKRNLVVDLNDKSFINVIGFDTIGGSVRMDNSRMCMVNGLDMKYISHYIHTADGYEGYIDFSTTTEDKTHGGITYPIYKPAKNANGAPERGAVGNYIGGTDNIFINNKIDHSAGAGLYLTGAYTYIDNNYMNDVGYAGSYVAGIFMAPKTYIGKYKSTYGGHGIYNNTIYNMGRSAWTAYSYKSEQMPYMPCEIAYNDFHDGMLTSADTGMTYEYFANMGYDGVMTKMHHNYIYLTTDEEDYNPLSYGIYHDNSAFGIDTYKNKLFYTQEGSGYSKEAVYEQDATHAPANINVWDNTQIGYLPSGTDALSEAYFTEGKAFYAGTKDSSYLTNYNNVKGNDYGMSATTTSANFGKSGKVTIDENSKYADFNADGEWVKFTVSAPSGANTLGLAVRGDSHYTYDTLGVYIVPAGDASGTSSTSAEYYEVSVDIGARDLDTPETVYTHINPISGSKDIYVKATDYRSAQIGGVSVFKAEGAAADARYAMKGYAGNYNSAGNDYYPAPIIEADYTNPLAIGTAAAKTGYKTYLVYKNCVFSGASNKFIVSASAGAMGGADDPVRSIQVYVTSPGGSMTSSTKKADFVIANTSWDETGYQIVDISEIAAGTYDVYLSFPVKGNVVVRDFGFLKTGADTTGF